jgi:hypothetical protein
MENEEQEKLTKEDQILNNTTKICTELEMIRRDYTKIVYALIAVIAANLGIKLAGTPAIVDIMIYLSLFSGVFTGLMLISAWKFLQRWMRVLQAVFSIFMIFNGIAQIWLYRPGEQPSPLLFNPVTDGFHILLAIILILSAWSARGGLLRVKRANNQCGNTENKKSEQKEVDQFHKGSQSKS